MKNKPKPRGEKIIGWHFHKWTEWGEDYIHPVSNWIVQARHCVKCSMIQTKIV